MATKVAPAFTAVSVVTKKQLTLDAADAIASGALAAAATKKFKAISVVVMDNSGRELVAKTMPDCPPLIPHIAAAKAGAAIGTHSSSRAIKDKYLPDRLAQLLSMATIGGNNGLPFAAVPGGVLVRDSDGDIVGSVGVSGASADEDECARGLDWNVGSCAVLPRALCLAPVVHA